ncbi:MAG: HAMP domain-containing protein [Acidobacteria bacterium]|nr:HAMP domain-containing protein [Acidobacteriota bacterium]
MKTSTRLILMLTLTVSAVMVAATYYSLRLRAQALERAALDEVRAHAITLQLALEENYAAGRQDTAQRLINRLGENTGVTGVILFDRNGAVQLLSASLKQANLTDSDEARRVIAGHDDIPIRRRLNNVEVLSYIHPLIVQGERVGAMELTLPVAFVEAEIRQAGGDSLLILGLLCLVILSVVGVATRYNLTRPINLLLAGAEELGRGNLSHRVTIPHRGGEFAMLARAFNQMADSLAEQRRRAEREAYEKLELERRLRHHERLAAVGQLAAGVAHELGAPLQVIDGRAKQLQEQTEVSREKQQRNLGIIRTQADRITRMVRNLLNLARPYHPRPCAVDLRKVTTHTLETLETQTAQAGVQVEHQAKSAVMVSADAELLQQVFLNICLNALQAMPTGGLLRVTYDTEATPREGRNFMAVRVYDTGVGIATAHLETIFNPFFTTKEVGHNTGLGLAVSSRIVEEHGGWIEAANWQDGKAQGAVFAVYLPQPIEQAQGGDAPRPALLQEALH